jgi:CBS domain containing-hemolysin-like protein
MPEAEQPLSWVARLKGAFSREEVAEDGAPEDKGRAAASEARVLNAARFDTLRVEDVMVPRADIVAVEVDTPLKELARLFADAAHSRLPVYRETLDEPVGVVHIKDVLRLLAENVGGGGDAAVADKPVLSSITRPVLYVPPSMPVADLLLRMQTRRIHMALVVDEFGGTDGLLTLEDLVEEIVGDIADEHEKTEEPAIRARGATLWDVDARAPIEDLEALTGRSLDLPEAVEEEVDTLGGLVFALAGRVPERGEVIVHPAGVEFEVVDADPRRVKRMLVRLREIAPVLQPAGNGK